MASGLSSRVYGFSRKYVRDGKVVVVTVPIEFTSVGMAYLASEKEIVQPLFDLWQAKRPGWYQLSCSGFETITCMSGVVHPGYEKLIRVSDSYSDWSVSSLDGMARPDLCCDLEPIEEKTLAELDEIVRINKDTGDVNWYGLHYLSTERFTEVLAEAKRAQEIYQRVYDEHWKREFDALDQMNRERREREQKAWEETAEKRKRKAAETRQRNKKAKMSNKQ